MAMCLPTSGICPYCDTFFEDFKHHLIFKTNNSVTEMCKSMLKMTSLLGGGNGFQMSFGIGAFPFGFFATNFNMGDSGHTHVHGMRGHGAPEGSAQFEEEQFLHKVLGYEMTILN